MTLCIRDALSFAQQALVLLDSPRLDAEILIGLILKKPRIFLITHPEYPLTAQEEASFRALIQSRQAGCPIAYLVGEREFWSLAFKVTPHVLIPRPETELCVQVALELIQMPDADIADIGTGSGCIAIALAHERPQWKIIATDIQAEALKIAQLNAHTHACHNIQFEHRNGLQGFLPHTLDAVMSNPPYIDQHDPALETHVKQYEPHSALIADDQGYSILFQIAEEARSILKPGGWLILEHGQGQDRRLAEHLKSLGYDNIQSRKDLQGIARVLNANTKESNKNKQH